MDYGYILTVFPVLTDVFTKNPIKTLKTPTFGRPMAEKGNKKHGISLILTNFNDF